jgi:acetyl-CoA synthetase
MVHGMAWETIRKNRAAVVSTVRLADYDEACRSFRWRDARAELDGLPGGGLNIAYEALDRHVAKGNGGKPALRWVGRPS